MEQKDGLERALLSDGDLSEEEEDLEFRVRRAGSKGRSRFRLDDEEEGTKQQGRGTEAREKDGYLSEASEKEIVRNKYYHSDSAMSEDGVRFREYKEKRRDFSRRLPMIPSKARFPSAPTKRGASNKLPRKIPRRIKGRFRRIAADWEDEMVTRRVSVYCPSNEIDLDQVYAHLVQVRQRYGDEDPLKPVTSSTEEFSFENNKTTIVPTIYVANDHPSPLTGTGQSSRRDTLESPSWVPSIFFDVLHLKQFSLDYGKPTSLARRRKSMPDKSQALKEDNQERTMSRNASDYEEEEYEDVFEWEGYREVFLFGFGCIVFWNWDGPEPETRFVSSLLQHCKQIYEPDAAESAADDLEFFQGKKSSVKHDTIEICSGDPIERLAVSFAFAQSSLLSLYEFRLDQIIERNEHIPVALARYGRIHMSQEEISKEIGRLFMERNMINLESDLILTPEFFWENDEWEPVYKRIATYMEQDERHEILNKRLDCVRELLDVLASQVENQHASKLEWIIIWLILSEVVVQVVWGVFIKDILGFFNHCGSD